MRSGAYSGFLWRANVRPRSLRPGPEGRSSALQALLLFPASVAPWPTLSTPGLPLALLVAPAFLGIVEPHRNLIEAKHSDLQQAAASQPRSLHRGQQRSGSVRCACARQGGSCMRVGPYRRAPPRPEMALFSFLCNLPAPGWAIFVSRGKVVTCP